MTEIFIAYNKDVQISISAKVFHKFDRIVDFLMHARNIRSYYTASKKSRGNQLPTRE